MDKHIKEYLLKYGRVQITDFGVFEVVYKSSLVHPILHTFSVPGKYVVFTENKMQDDDFALFVSKKEKITQEEAKSRIENWVQDIWKTVREEKKQFNVSTLGSFFINAMARIEFAATLDTDISPQSFGLEDFKAKLPVPVVEKTSETVKITETETIQPKREEIIVELPKAVVVEKEEEKEVEMEAEEPQPEKKKKKRVGLWIFLILLLLCGLFVGVVYFAFPDTFVNYKGKAVELFEDVKAKFTKNDAVIDEVIDTENTIIEDEQPDIEPQTPTSEPETSPVSIETGNYYVIIGSFRESTNADDFLKQKQSEYSNVVNLGMGKSGYYLIGIGGYSKEEAENKRNEIPNAWVFIK